RHSVAPRRPARTLAALPTLDDPLRSKVGVAPAPLPSHAPDDAAPAGALSGPGPRGAGDRYSERGVQKYDRTASQGRDTPCFGSFCRTSPTGADQPEKSSAAFLAMSRNDWFDARVASSSLTCLSLPAA